MNLTPENYPNCKVRGSKKISLKYVFLYNYHMKLIRRILLVLGLVAVMGGIYGIARAQDQESKSFPETGFTVRGAFYQFYKQYPHPLIVFGYPISDEVRNTRTRVLSQYFQKARFDLVDGKIQLADLGQMMYDGSGSAPRGYKPTSGACRLFEATQKRVCYDFLTFYDQNQGTELFGNPISEFIELPDKRIVQYFERARLEWRPSNVVSQWVVVSDLGWIHHELNKNQYDPEVATNIPADLVKPQAYAFVSNVLLTAGNSQTLYVIVQDQHLNPIQGAMVLVEIMYPNGKQDDLRLNSTDENGISTHTFTVEGLKFQDVVPIQVKVDFDGLKTETSTWFREWW